MFPQWCVTGALRQRIPAYCVKVRAIILAVATIALLRRKFSPLAHIHAKKAGHETVLFCPAVTSNVLWLIKHDDITTAA